MKRRQTHKPLVKVIRHMDPNVLRERMKLDQSRKEARILRLQRESLNPFNKLRGVRV